MPTDIIIGQGIANVEGIKASYSAAVNAHAPAATPTDWFTILGSATKIIRITRIRIALRSTAAAQYRVSVLKYSTAYTAGTPASVPMLPHDPNDAAASALVQTWNGGLPTVGTPIAKVEDDSILSGVLGTPVFQPQVVYDYGIRNAKEIVLRGVAQYLALNSAAVALPGGLVADVKVEWTEE